MYQRSNTRVDLFGMRSKEKKGGGDLTAAGVTHSEAAILLSKSSSYAHQSVACSALGVGGRVLVVMRAIVIRPSASCRYKAGTMHAGFSRDQAGGGGAEVF